MRIEFVAPRFYPHVGGIEEACGQLALGLTRRRHRVRVHTLRTPGLPDRDTWNGIEVRRYPAVRERGYYTTRFEPDLEGDVIHLHAYAHHTNDWVIRKWHGKVPIFLSTHHGSRFPKPRPVAKFYYAWYNRFVGFPNLRRLNGVLVPTGWDAQHFVDRGIDHTKVHVVPSGADAQAFGRHAPWFPPGVTGPFLLYLGRLHEEKGLRELLDAYDEARPKMPLVIAGRDDGMLPELRSRATGVPDVHFVEEFTPDQKWGLLAACRALVLASRYEGQGIVLAEAWAQRKPVVATRAGAVPSVVADEVDGLLVPVGDVDRLAQAMQRIVRNDTLARRLGEAGREKAEEQFQWDKILDKLEAIYSGRRPDDSSVAPSSTPKA